MPGGHWRFRVIGFLALGAQGHPENNNFACLSPKANDNDNALRYLVSYEERAGWGHGSLS